MQIFNLVDWLQPLFSSYGWYPDLQPVQKNDPRLYRAHRKSHITWLAEQILLGTRDIPKPPPFTGIPFKT